VGLNALCPLFLGDDMILSEIIARYDNERKNTEDKSVKQRWVEELERIVLDDVILTHQNEIENPDEYFDDWGDSKELLIPMQYADVYINYIDMKMQLKLNQLQKYNSASTLFNNAYLTYQQWYNRHNMPLYTKKWTKHEVI
jgi:hypothetical protein